MLGDELQPVPVGGAAPHLHRLLDDLISEQGEIAAMAAIETAKLYGSHLRRSNISSLEHAVASATEDGNAVTLVVQVDPAVKKAGEQVRITSVLGRAQLMLPGSGS